MRCSPAAQTDIWYFDGSPMGGAGEWKIAGKGAISPDGKTIIGNPGTGIPRFCGVCGLLSASCPPAGGGGCTGGNPVDLFNGQEMQKREHLKRSRGWGDPAWTSV